MQNQNSFTVDVLDLLSEEAELRLAICLPSLRHRLSTAVWTTDASDYERLLAVLYPMVLDSITSLTHELTQYRFDVTTAVTLALGAKIAEVLGVPAEVDQLQ